MKRGGAAIVGAAESDIGQVGPGFNVIDLMAQGITRALDDCGLGLKDVDGLICASTQSRTSPLNLFIGRLLVRLPFFCLVNLLAEKRVVPELLQGDANVERITAEVTQLWSGEARDTCLRGLDEVRARLEGAGAACSERVAKVLVSFLLP